MNDLQSLYESRYAGKMRFQTSRPGTHSVILETIAEELPGARVLDVGCGAGRLSLMSARQAESVHGVDFSEHAIALARIVADVCGSNDNVTFTVRTVDETYEGSYDVIFLSEVIEHVPDPLTTLRNLHSHLVDNGLLVVSCPSFLNFRGYLWLLLQETFQLLMSPSDVRQVYPYHMQTWIQMVGFSIERIVGLHFDLGWTEDAVADMIRRIRLAVRDKRVEVPAWNSVMTKFDAMDTFLRAQTAYHSEFLTYLIGHDILRKTRNWSLPVVSPEVVKGDADLLREIKAYLPDKQTLFADRRPFNLMGAVTVYVLRKMRK